jgi:hypothetical protein
MTFELLRDIMDRFLNLRESVRTPARIRPYPTGRILAGDPRSKPGRLAYVSKASRLTLGFGHFLERSRGFLVG